MNTQKKFLKVLSMLTIILLIATIFIPGNGNRNAVASIGILGILMLFLSTLLPKIYKPTQEPGQNKPLVFFEII